MDYFNLIQESIDRACNTSIIDIIITGDFNYDISTPQNKISELIHEFDLTQLITEPKHYTETSTSTIDLILVRNNTNVLCSGVADSFIPEQVRYHCPTIVILKFLRAYIPSYKRRIWNFQLADYEKYKRLLNESNILEKIESERNIDKNVQDISDAIIKAAEISIPNKIITVRPTDPPWITCYIKRLIQKQKLAFRQHKKTNNIHYWNKYKTLRNKVITELRKSKQSYHDNLDQLLSSGECNSKTFWKTSKLILKLGQVSASIPTLHHNGIYAESDHEKYIFFIPSCC